MVFLLLVVGRVRGNVDFS